MKRQAFPGLAGAGLFLTALAFTFTAFAADLINEGFNNYHQGSRPAGWTFTGCGANSDTFTTAGNYGNALPSLKLDSNNDAAATVAFSNPVGLRFWFKGQYSVPTSHLLVEQYLGGWAGLTDIYSIPTSGTTAGPIGLNASATRIQFTWKATGNVLALDDVVVSGAVAPSPSPSPSAVVPPPSPTPSSQMITPTPTVPGPTPTPSLAPLLGCEGFDNYHLGSRPAGWSFINCDQNSDTYTAPTGYFGVALPSIKLSETGDCIVTRPFAAGSYDLSFWLRGVGTDASSSLIVEEFYASSWKPLAVVQPLPGSGTTEGPYQLNAATSILQFCFNRASSGAAAVDDVCLSGGTPPPTPTPPLPTPTPPPITPPPSPTPVPPARITDHFDFNGDGTSDIAVFRSSAGLWAVRGLTRAFFGTPADIPAPADYDGNATTDIAIYRPSAGMWRVRYLTTIYYGLANDQPLPGDYDGDGTAEAALFRAANGYWCVRNCTRLYFGLDGDEPVPRDYTGDGTREIGIFRPATGRWVLRLLTQVYLGAATDSAIPAYYQGSASCVMAVFRANTGLWAIRGMSRFNFGALGDVPRTADYDGDWTDQPIIFKPSGGLWAIRDVTRFNFGVAGDTPLAR